MTIVEQIRELAQKKKALILAHNYQNSEIQDIADFTGDSLELSKIALEQGKEKGIDIIVFCGVHFMAESAKILSPGKTVLLPEPSAGCPMADMATPEDVLEMKMLYPRAKVVTYINSTAAVKAVSDVICTSSNAKTIIERIDADEILFVPDKNLGRFIQRFTKKKLHLWEGFCPTHERFTRDELMKAKREHPDSLVMVHPECRPEVIDLADMALSTGQMVRFVQETDAKSIIVGTEIGMLHKLKKVAPHIEFIHAADSLICPNMKKVNYQLLYLSLLHEVHQIEVLEEVRVKALRALNLMMELSR